MHAYMYVACMYVCYIYASDHIDNFFKFYNFFHCHRRLMKILPFNKLIFPVAYGTLPLSEMVGSAKTGVPQKSLFG